MVNWDLLSSLKLLYFEPHVGLDKDQTKDAIWIWLEVFPWFTGNVDFDETSLNSGKVKKWTRARYESGEIKKYLP